MTMTFKTLIKYILACWVLLCSCASSHYVQNEIVVNDNADVTLSSDIMDGIRIVKPMSSDSKSVIGRVDRVLSLNENIYIVDRKNNKLLSFDIKGNFESSTEPLIGRGKMEYIRIMDATVDPMDSLIYIYCDASYKILVLDAALNVISSYSFDDLFYEIAISGNFLYALCKSNDGFELRQYDKRHLDGKYKTLLSQTEIIHGVMGMGKSMNSDGNTCYVSMPFSNKFYKINNDIIESENVVDFGDLWFDYDKSKDMSGSLFIKHNSDKIWTIANIVSTDSLLLFNTNKAGLISVVNGTQATINEEIQNIEIPFTSTLIYPIGGVCGKMVMIVPNSTIINYQDYCTSHKIEISLNNKELNKLIKNYKYSDNPLLVITTIK